MTTTQSPGITQQQIDSYHEQGFVRVPGLLDSQEVERFRVAALEAARSRDSRGDGTVFAQHVNNWQHHEVIRQLTLMPRLAEMAQTLAGAPLRLWHDHTLIKQPHNNVATEFHQDQPYWPHADSPHALSAWIALCDVPVERGCMSFLPKSHHTLNLPPQNLRDANSLFSLCPELKWTERVTVPLRAGECTFHHGLTAHMANANQTDEPRVAHVVIFMDQATTKADGDHPVTVDLGLEVGQVMDHPLFPTADQIISGAVR